MYFFNDCTEPTKPPWSVKCRNTLLKRISRFERFWRALIDVDVSRVNSGKIPPKSSVFFGGFSMKNKEHPFWGGIYPYVLDFHPCVLIFEFLDHWPYFSEC